MASQDSLFFLADFNRYKQAKINLLAAKSGILSSRGHIQSLKKTFDKEEEYRKDAKKGLTNTKRIINELKGILPSMKKEMTDKIKKEEEMIKKASSKKSEKQKIDEEIEEINIKIRELEKL